MSHQQRNGKRKCGIYIHTMEYHSAINRNEIVPFADTWMDPETVTPSEVSQKEKNKLSYINAYI